MFRVDAPWPANLAISFYRHPKVRRDRRALNYANPLGTANSKREIGRDAVSNRQTLDGVYTYCRRGCASKRRRRRRRETTPSNYLRSAASPRASIQFPCPLRPNFESLPQRALTGAKITKQSGVQANHDCASRGKH